MRYSILSNNVCLAKNLVQDGAFTDASACSMGILGACHRIPRVTSNISIEDHFSNRCFVRFCCIFTITDTGQGPTTVSITNPVTVNAANGIIVTNCCLVFDTVSSPTISVTTTNCDPLGGLQFRRWEDSLGNILSTNTATGFILANINPNAAWLRAVWNDCEGGGASGS